MVLIDHLKSLKAQNFQKLIIGAALKDFQSIEDYSYYFTHAQANAIDISAFPHSVISTKKGILKALKENPNLNEPLIMISVNIGEDPHFRRIELDTNACTNCLDCIPTCPSEAFNIADSTNEIAAHPKDARNDGQLLYNIDLCFGCSNCLPACKDNALSFVNWNSFDTNSLKELIDIGVSAIELHLNSDLEGFKTFYQKLPKSFKLESFCIGSSTSNQKELENAVDVIIESSFNKHGEDFSFIIQTDGIPLSGARELKLENKDQFSINKAKLVIDYIKNKYPSLQKQIFVQIAGGTNEKSLNKAHEQNISISGVAIGSYARKKIKEADKTQDAIKIAKEMVSYRT
jgi:NAD-dependent dihydropyrimidine dehydrogenase PreA subunit